MVDAQKEAFDITSVRSEKRAIAVRIISQVNDLQPHGRFLREDTNTNAPQQQMDATATHAPSTVALGGGEVVHPSILRKIWVPVENDEAVQKVMHRLREKEYSYKKKKGDRKSVSSLSSNTNTVISMSSDEMLSNINMLNTSAGSTTVVNNNGNGTVQLGHLPFQHQARRLGYQQSTPNQVTIAAHVASQRMYHQNIPLLSASSAAATLGNQQPLPISNQSTLAMAHTSQAAALASYNQNMPPFAAAATSLLPISNSDPLGDAATLNRMLSDPYVTFNCMNDCAAATRAEDESVLDNNQPRDEVQHYAAAMSSAAVTTDMSRNTANVYNDSIATVTNNPPTTTASNTSSSAQDGRIVEEQEMEKLQKLRFH